MRKCEIEGHNTWKERGGQSKALPLTDSQTRPWKERGRCRKVKSAGKMGELGIKEDPPRSTLQPPSELQETHCASHRKPSNR